jgi:hypothetical protein
MPHTVSGRVFPVLREFRGKTVVWRPVKPQQAALNQRTGYKLNMLQRIKRFRGQVFKLVSSH